MTRSGVDKKVEISTSQKIWVSETECLAMCHNDEDVMKKGIAKGDIRVKDTGQQHNNINNSDGKKSNNCRVTSTTEQ